LVDSDDDDEAAPGVQPATRQPLAAEGELLTLAGLQEMSIDTIAEVAGAELVRRIEQLDVIPAGQQLVAGDVEVDVLLVDGEIEVAGHLAAELQRPFQRLRDERDAIVALRIAVDEVGRRRPARISAIGEADGLANESRARSLATGEQMPVPRQLR